MNLFYLKMNFFFKVKLSLDLEIEPSVEIEPAVLISAGSISTSRLNFHIPGIQKRDTFSVRLLKKVHV